MEDCGSAKNAAIHQVSFELNIMSIDVLEVVKVEILKCKTNHIINPLGFAMKDAVVSWVADREMSKKQVRAQIQVALDKEMKELIYVSDISENPDSTGVKLPIALKPRTAYYWTVEVWGEAGDSAGGRFGLGGCLCIADRNR